MYRVILFGILSVASVCAGQDAKTPAELEALRNRVPQPSYDRVHPKAQPYIELMRENLLKAPDSAAAWDTFGVTCFAYELFDCAETCYREANELSPNQFFYLYHLAILLDRKPSTTELVSVLKSAINLRPTYVPAHWRLGKALEELGHTDEALAEYRKLIATAPESGLGQKGVGEIALAQGKNEEARKDLELAVANLEPDKETLKSLAIANQRLGNEDRAAELQAKIDSLNHDFKLDDPLANGVRNRNPGDVTLLSKAKHDVGAGDYEKAIPEFLRYLEGSPNDFTAQVYLATCFRATNQPEKARPYAEGALAIDGSSVAAHLELTAIYLMTGDREMGLKSYEQTRALDPENSKIDTWVADVLLQQGYTDDAISAYVRAKQHGDLEADAEWKWGLALGEKGDISGAIDHFQEAIHRNADFANAYFSMGMAYEKLGRPKEAMEQYRIALKIDPNHPAKQRLARLEAQTP